MDHSSPDLSTLSSTKPYLVRALYEWILDNQLTPHLLVDAQYPSTQVPGEFIQDGQIVLNLAPTAVRNLSIGNDSIQFGARFGGVARELYIPTEAVIGIFARENHQGMIFPQPLYPGETPSIPESTRGIGEGLGHRTPGEGARPDQGGDQRRPKGGPQLKLVK